MDIGTIVIWPGNPNSLPQGWRICDGSQLKKSKYPELHEKIGIYWDRDDGYNAEFFRIPDLRGVFLRGVSDDRGDKYKDPSVDKRERPFTKEEVAKSAPGSYQMGEVGKHTHDLVSRSGAGNPSDAISLYQASAVAGHNGSITSASSKVIENSGAETRPVNVYVHFVIRVE